MAPKQPSAICSEIRARVLSNFEYSKAPNAAGCASHVNICIDRPLELQVFGVTQADAAVRAMDLVVCSSSGAAVAEFRVQNEHLRLQPNEAHLSILIDGSKRHC